MQTRNPIETELEFKRLVQGSTNRKRIRELMETHGYSVPNTSPKLSRLNELSKLLNQCVQLCFNNLALGREYYFTLCINNAIENDNAKEILYILKNNPNSLHRYNSNQNSFLIENIMQNKISIIKAIFDLYNATSDKQSEIYKLIINGNNVFQALQHAVINNQVDIVKILYEIYFEAYGVGNEQKKFIEFLLKIAEENNLTEIVSYFADEMEDFTFLLCQETFNLPEYDFEDEYFIVEGGDAEQSNLTIKGVTLILDYYKNKDNSNPMTKVFVSENFVDFGNLLALFAKSSDQKLNIIVTHGNHYVLARCEKHENKLKVMFIDSKALLCIELMRGLCNESAYGELLSTIDFYVNRENQQTDHRSCLYYSLKNLRQVDKSSKFFEMLYEDNLITNKKLSIYDVTTSIFLTCFTLPPGFMHLTTSYNIIQDYFIKNSNLVKEFYRIKNGVMQNLQEYIYAKRNEFIVTPEETKNKNIDKVIRNEEQAIIYKNNSIAHFRIKYNTVILKEQLNKFNTYEKRCDLIKSYNGALVTCHPVTSELVPIHSLIQLASIIPEDNNTNDDEIKIEQKDSNSNNNNNINNQSSATIVKLYNKKTHYITNHNSFFGNDNRLETKDVTPCKKIKSSSVASNNFSK